MSRPLADAALAEVVRSLAEGTDTVESVARALLERIDAHEPTVRAWTYVDPDAVLARARELDLVEPARRGVLHGVPVGVKDIFDTHDMPTAYGSPIYEGHRPVVDAASVAIARRCGMLPLGKLVTTEFAAWPPGPTVNPHDVTRTPGGSSSGSAAAVAAGMAPVAFATQTTGSIIRPAAFCGVVGYKPSHGTLPTAGVKAISESFDTVGVIARTVADAALVVGTLSGRSLEPPQELPAPTRDLPDPRVARSVSRDRGALRCAPGPACTSRCVADARRPTGGLRRARGCAGHGLDVRDRPLPGGRARALPRADPRAAPRDARRRCRDPRLRVRRVLPMRARVWRRAPHRLRRGRRGARPGRARRGARGRHDRRSCLQPGLVRARRARDHGPGGSRAVGTALGVQIIAPRGHDARALACAAWVEAALAPTAERAFG